MYPYRQLVLFVLSVVIILQLLRFYGLHPSKASPEQLSGTSSNLRKLQDYESEFPRRIWQAYGLVGDGDGSGLEKWDSNRRTWTQNNPEWEYTLLTNDTATAFVDKHFGHRPAIVHFWHELGPTILRADFIRYLALLAIGGVYSDVDTSNLKAMSKWIPESLHSEKINAIVSIEYDDTNYALFVRPICFSQWTMMAKPNHPLFETAVKRFMGNMEFLARLKGQELSAMITNKKDVLQGTGPGMFTDAVMETIRDQTGQSINWSTFHDQREPKLFGDILVLPINGFGSGQKHSHSSDPKYGEPLVRHHFGKSWYAHD